MKILHAILFTDEQVVHLGRPNLPHPFPGGVVNLDPFRRIGADINQTSLVDRHTTIGGTNAGILLGSPPGDVFVNVISAPCFGRNREELEGLIGFFVNSLVMRTSLEDDPTFRQLVDRVRGAAVDAYEHQENQIRQMAAISDRAYRIMAGLAISGILIGIGSAYMAFRYTRRSIHKLIRATQEIASGNFNVIPQIKGAGELQTLADAFSKMGNRLATLEKRNLDTNPLTHLPGGATIETVLEARLENKLPSVFCLVEPLPV